MRTVYFFATQTRTVHSISQLSQLFEEYVQQQQFQRKPVQLYEPVEYILNLKGKRLRPLLVLMAAELFGKDVRLCLPQAFAIELFHNFSLIHDDIMDQAPIRRGKETVHKKFNQNTAILSGDVMLVWAYEYLAMNQTEKLPQLLRLFNQTAMEVCEGQQIDLLFEDTMPNIEEYIEMITLKTAVLLGAALQMGAILAGADNQDTKHIYEFGRKTGIAFQLLDDILDTFGTTENFGKKIGGDIIQNKKTILLLNALKMANADQREALNTWLQTRDKDEEKIKAVTQLIKETGAEEESRRMMQKFHHEALQHLDTINTHTGNKQELLKFSELLLTRVA